MLSKIMNKITFGRGINVPFIIVAIMLVVSVLTGCSTKDLLNKTIDKSGCSQPGSYFVEGEDRYVLVDDAYQRIGNHTYRCKVFADKYMLTMYLKMTDMDENATASTGMTQIFYEDGSPMIYDPTEEEWKEWEND